MENGVEIAPVAVANGLEEEGAAAAGEQDCFYTPAYRHRAPDLEAAEQEGFYTPAYRHRGSTLMEEGFSTPKVNEGGGHGGENGAAEFRIDPNGPSGDRVVVDDDDDDDAGVEAFGEEPVVSEKTDAAVDARGDEVEEKRGDVNAELDDGEGDSVVTDEGEGVYEDGEQKFVVNRESQNGEDHHQVVSDGNNAARPKEESGNGDNHQLVSDGQIRNGENVEVVSDVAESKQEVDPDQGVGVVLDVSVSDGKSDGQIGNGEIVESKQEADPDQGVGEVLDDSDSNGKVDGMESKAVGTTANTYASVVKQGLSGKPEKQAEGDGLSSVRRPGIREESVMVEDLGESSSNNDDDNGISSQSAAQTTSSFQNSGTPSLSICPADQGVDEVLDDSYSNGKVDGMESKAVGTTANTYASVVKQGLSGKPEKQAEGDGLSSVRRPGIREESVMVEDLGESSSNDDDNNGISSQSAAQTTSSLQNSGTPSLPIRPADQGVYEVLDDSDSNGKVDGMESKAVGTTANTYASVVKQGLSRKPEKQAEGDGLSSVRRPGMREEHEEESVMMEDLGESSSNDDDDNGISSQSATQTTSSLQNSGTPSLPIRPAGLGSSASLLEPAPRPIQQPKINGAFLGRASQPLDEPANDDPEESDETRKKLQDIRVKFLRLARRLGQTPHNVVVAQVLYRLGLAEQLSRNTNRPGVFSFDRASVMAEQLEAAGEDLKDFTCTIMVIGKAGVGKSATINSILDEDSKKVHTDPFHWGTKKVQVINGKVQGVQVRVIDTPGLFTSSSDQQHNGKILTSVKKLISKTPPDIVLYFDRLDMQSRDNGDMLLLRTITDIFGPSIWFNAIVVLTHAASAPPDGPNGVPLSYDMFVTQRSHVVQQAIRTAAGDVRLMNPVSLVENHSACRTNRNGQRVLPNGQVWKPQLLLLSFASKILAEANMLLKLQDTPTGRPFGAGSRIPPLPFFLSPLLQSRPQLKLPEEQLSDDDDAEMGDLDRTSDSDEGSDYDDLPPFKNLTKAQLAKLSKAQKKAYFEELEYREKLFLKKQLKEERKRRKFMKNMAEATRDLPNDYNGDTVEDESSGPASVPVPMPDLVLPTSFDSDNPTHRYRFLDTSNQWVVRPVLETQGWDHDIGYEGLNLERLFVVKDKVPVSLSGQLTKDKKECTLQMEVASSIKHNEAGATSLSLDVQTLGKDMAYTVRGETRIKNFKRNNTTAGVSVSVLGDAMSAGVKIEDKLVVNKRFRFLVSGGAMTGRGDVAYGGRLEATLRDKDHPIGRTLSTLALSVVDWRGDLAVGCNVQSQIPVGRGTNLIGHANLSNRGTGQVGIRLNSSEQLQIALLAFLPIFRNLKRLFESPDSMM